MKKPFLFTIMLGILTLFTSCDDNDMVEDSSEQRSITIENVIAVKDFVQSGTFQGTGTPPVILPGQTVSFNFNAAKGQSLMFTTMYGASKDWFFAPENPGLKLYQDNGMPITGDVSSSIKLWDNGSKNDGTGTAENNPIMMVPGVNASTLMKLILSYNEAKSEFTLAITNTSGGTANETPFSPGVWAISNVLGGSLINSTPFYKAGSITNAEITAVAETGNNAPLAAKVINKTGIITGLSPVLIVVYRGDTNPIFQIGAKDMGKGLKELAQMGDVSKLKSSLEGMQGIRGVYVAGNGPIAPGTKVEMNIAVGSEDKIAYATMFGYSNDWFYANESTITSDMKGDLTSKTDLFDNGTGVDQYPGAGNKQVLFNGVPDPENKNIEKVGSQVPIPSVSSVLKIIYQ
ncbi:spondin domain-containing protein [Chryseobacterium tongliaoense]|uniref:spondin domain-containing protein n=1 Tax=Chryseobacterium tongliaoense TaxID=3240933 RepID=UPI00351722ED